MDAMTVKSFDNNDNQHIFLQEKRCAVSFQILWMKMVKFILQYSQKQNYESVDIFLLAKIADKNFN